MFSPVHPPVDPAHRTTASALEPYVSYFDVQSRDQNSFLFPFQVMGYCLGFFLLVGFYFTLFKDDPSISAIVVWMFCIFGPFYVPGVYHYRRCLNHDWDTQLEIDSRNRWLRYTNHRKGENFLFHADQVEKCQVSISILFPYRIDHLTLVLQGGKKIHVSGLVASPREVIDHLDLKYEVERRLFNSVPKVVAA